MFYGFWCSLCYPRAALPRLKSPRATLDRLLTIKLTANEHSVKQQLLNEHLRTRAVGQLQYHGDLWSFLVDRYW